MALSRRDFLRLSTDAAAIAIRLIVLRHSLDLASSPTSDAKADLVRRPERAHNWTHGHSKICV